MADWALLARVVNDQLADRGMTRAELAEQSGLPEATLRAIQDGEEQEHAPATLEAVSRALGLPGDHLWRVVQGTTDPGEPWSDEELSALRTALDDTGHAL